jgi:2-polyprenyl-3-methyl-5-hydroxy-6-metoxy-1,4-benzoquinol methylase
MKLPAPILKKIARRSNTLWDHFYVPAKLRSDPVYEAVTRELTGSSLPVLDIGCGLGLLTHYLREAGHRAPMAGFDSDPRKIASAQAMARTAGYSDVVFHVGDARNDLPRHQGDVVIVDILQFIQPAEQASLLRDAATRVAPGGKVIIRSCLRDASRRFRITVLGDWFARATLWMKQAPVAYPSASELEAILSDLGLSVTIIPLWGGTWFNNHLIVAQRVASHSTRQPSRAAVNEPPGF